MTARLIEPEKKKQIPEDYDFIKKNLRYPLRSFRRILPFFVITFITTLLFLRFVFSKPFQSFQPLDGFLLINALSIGAMFLGAYRYWRSLFFDRLGAAMDAGTNMALLNDFLRSRHFYVHQPEGHPEVYMISSREDSKYRETEIVVFIAVDKAILVNSHISTANLFPQRRRHYHEIVQSLHDYLRNVHPLNSLVKL